MVDVQQTDAQEYPWIAIALHLCPVRPTATSQEEAQDLSALMNRIALAGKIIARRLSCVMEGVLGFTGDMQGESVKRWMSTLMMFYLGIQAKWTCSSLGRGNGKPYYIPKKLSYWSIYCLTRLTAPQTI